MNPKPQAKAYAPRVSVPIAWRIRRMLQSDRTACSGVRRASQNVPLEQPAQDRRQRPTGVLRTR